MFNQLFIHEWMSPTSTAVPLTLIHFLNIFFCWGVVRWALPTLEERQISLSNRQYVTKSIAPEKKIKVTRSEWKKKKVCVLELLFAFTIKMNNFLEMIWKKEKWKKSIKNMVSKNRSWKIERRVSIIKKMIFFRLYATRGSCESRGRY